MVTIKQLEKELNVSKVSLYTILKKDQFSRHIIRGEKNVIMLDDTGAEKLREYYTNKMRGGPPYKYGTNSEVMNAISALQQQLAKKDEQIESLLALFQSQGRHERRA